MCGAEARVLKHCRATHSQVAVGEQNFWTMAGKLIDRRSDTDGASLCNGIAIQRELILFPSQISDAENERLRFRPPEGSSMRAAVQLLASAKRAQSSCWKTSATVRMPCLLSEFDVKIPTAVAQNA